MKKINKKTQELKLLAFLALVVFTMDGHSQETGGTWTLALGAGSANVSDEVVTPAGVDSNDKDTSFHITLGYDISDNFSLALDYVDLGKGESRYTADTLDPLELQTANLDNVPVLGNGISLMAEYTFYQWQLIDFVGGAGIYIWDAEVKSISEANILSKDIDGTDLTYSLAAHYQFSSETKALLKWQRYQLEPNKVNELYVGIAYQF